MRIELKFEVEKRDCWIGVYWTTTSDAWYSRVEIWICLLPCLPLHLTIETEKIDRKIK